MKKSQTFKVGDAVVVKAKIKDPDLALDICGWQGRVSEVVAESNTICINWDSITLQNMPYAAIAECEERGLGWDQFYLKATEVEAAAARDTLADVKRVYEQLQDEHAWDHLGPEGRRIRQVLTGIDPDDEGGALRAWYQHLRQVLHLPFDAEIAEYQERGALQAGHKVTVEGFTDVDDQYGVIVQITDQRRSSHFPLCDLEATDTDSANHDYVQAYVVWFANR